MAGWVMHHPMQILGRADRLVGLVILSEGDLDLLDQLGPGDAGIRLGPRDWEFLLDREEHLVLARPAGAVDFVRGYAECRVGERAGDRDARLRGFDVERTCREVGAETPRDRQRLRLTGRVRPKLACLRRSSSKIGGTSSGWR
jgi:hypothetical protein